MPQAPFRSKRQHSAMKNLPPALAPLLTSAFFALACLAGCNINNGNVPGPCGLPGANCQNLDPSEDPTFPACSMQTLSFPQTDGYTVEATLSAFEAWNNYENCVTGPFTKAISLTPFDLALTPPAGGRVLMYYEFIPQVDQTIVGYPAVSITVPPTVELSGERLYIAADYYGAYGPWTLNASDGPLEVNGQTLSGPQTATDDAFGLTSGDPFEFALYSVPK